MRASREDVAELRGHPERRTRATRGPAVRHRSFAVMVLLATVAVAPASPAPAQSHTSALGLTVGGSVHSNLTPGLTSETRFQSGWIVGLQYERWIGTGRTGVRVNTLFTQRLLDTSPGGDYNVVMADVGLMVRMLPPRANRVVTPFAYVGLGATHYGSVAGTGPIAGGVYGEHVVRPHVLASIGADVASSGPAGIRLELGDKVVLPSVGYSPAFDGFPNVHNLIVTAAIQYRLGGPASPAYRPAAPAPEARPAPEPSPVPSAPERGAEGGPQPDLVMDSLRAVMDGLEAHVAELEREVDSLQTRIDGLERQTAPDDGALDERARYTVQVSAFLDSDRADRLTAELRADGVPTWRWDAVTRSRTFSRVRVGALPTRAAAERLAHLLKRQKGLPFWVDRIDPVEDVPAGAVRDTEEYVRTHLSDPPR